MSQQIQMKQVSRGNYLQRNVLKHNVVFNEGAKGDTAYILTEGSIEISGTVDGHKKVFAILKPISIFGEMALFLEDNARTATAIALEDSKVIVVTQDNLEEFIRESPTVISAIITVLVSRLKATTLRAMKAPSVGMGVARTLDLFTSNGSSAIKYDSFVKSMADSFLTTPEKIEGYLLAYSDAGLIMIGRDPNDVRIIRLTTKNILAELVRKKNE